MSTAGNTYLGSPENPNTAAVVSYITFIGWLFAYFAIYKKNKTPLAAFHLRQSLLLYLFLVLINLLFYWATDGFVKIMDIVWFILWLWGFIDSVNERKVPVPLIGGLAQILFKSL